MAASYGTVKKAVVDVVDDFTKLDIGAGYGTKYSAKTKLDKIDVVSAKLAVMPPRFNKVMGKLIGNGWKNVGPIDTVSCVSIGDVISLACEKGSITIPAGEPT